MKKLLYIYLPLLIFVCSCKQDDILKPDPRDKYVGHYMGLGVADAYRYVPDSVGQFSEIYLTKHPNIDNALQIESNTNPPINYPFLIGFGGFGNYSTTWDNPYDEKNRIYVSDEGFLYQKGLPSWEIGKICRYTEPDSIYCLVTYLFHKPNGSTSDYIFYIKAKRE